MNRQLKERIVGAIVIVALGIIVIPWLLDGPSQSPREVEQAIELPAVEPSGRTYTIPLDPAGGPPVQVDSGDASQVLPTRPGGAIRRPATESPAAPAPQPQAQPEQPPPRPAPQPDESTRQVETQPAPQPVPQPAVPEGGWTVQVGSFSRSDNAQALQRRLAGEGFEAFVSRVATDAGTMHRVRVGPVPERDAAERLLARVRAAGHESARVVRAED
jgi:DedD protein